jgi:hypothetical protein
MSSFLPATSPVSSGWFFFVYDAFLIYRGLSEIPLLPVELQFMVLLGLILLCGVLAFFNYLRLFWGVTTKYMEIRFVS